MITIKNIFISQPMKGRSAEGIKETRQKVITALHSAYGNNVKIFDTFFSGFFGNRLQFLGKSITEGLALADIAVFVDDWEKYDGCRCEHFIATQYGIKCIYYSTWTD
ncbi:hypothetical protein FACS189468_6650 [Spirochaetia bacterium]|nr:hypothetical protein FACS189468_6650 [Spirochaetia bacterium]